MAVDPKTVKTTDIAKAQSLDFVNQFTGGLSKLIEALGVVRKLPMSSGMTIKTYKSKAEMSDGNVAEGEIIPLSKAILEPAEVKELSLKKFRKMVTGEAIQRSGFAVAVSETDNILLKEIQKSVRADLFDGLKAGTGSGKGEGLQAALAQCWGLVQSKFEDDGVETVVFANPMDVAEYVGSANISTQTAFGMTFLSGFAGCKVITNTSVPAGTLYATAPQNLVCAYVNMYGSETSRAFDMYADQLGMIGVTHEPAKDCLSYETVAAMGVLFFAEMLDGVFKVQITKPKA